MKPESFAGWVLYDDACGFCRRWVPLWAGALARRGFTIAPLQSDWVPRALGLDAHEAARDLRLLLPDKRRIDGADVYRYVMRRIGWARPLYVLSITPGLRRVFDRTYRAFADNRFRVSRACGLVQPSARSTVRL